MKGYERIKRCPWGLIILIFICLSIALTGICSAKGIRKVDCDPAVYNPATRTCMKVYCHSNGKGEYRPVRWDKTVKLNCSSCHDAPPKNTRHNNVKFETCGQKCHTRSIKNGYTTNFHINGVIEGRYEGTGTGEEGKCLSCHSEPQNGRPAIAPLFQLISTHVGGPATDYDCIVCHIEENSKYHKNGQVELKNHQDGPMYTSSQYNQFCLGCHDTGNSLYGTTPFSTLQPIPVIHNELIAPMVIAGDEVRFWYPHNHTTGKEYTATQILQNSGSNSFFSIDGHTMMRLLSGVDIDSDTDSEGTSRKRTIGDVIGGSGMLISPLSLMNSGAGGLISNPLIATGAPLMAGTPTALLASAPAMGISPIAPIPMMGGGVGAATAIVTQIMMGGSTPVGAIAPAGVGGGMPAVSSGPGVELMNIIRSGPGSMVMGSGINPLTGLNIMGGPGLFGLGIMPGASLMNNPLMSLTGMFGIGAPGMGMYGYGMPGMGSMPSMGMYGYAMPRMGVMPGTGMYGYTMPGTGGMYGYGMPGMGMYGYGMPGMGAMPGTGMYGYTMPGMQGMPMNTNGMSPGSGMGTNNSANPGNQNQQNNTSSPTSACVACHTYEDTTMITYSVITNNYNGHFSHQNCIDCHAPHGSEFPGLMKPKINWNRNNRSCNTKSCHPTYRHTPPLAATSISYQLRPDNICNTSSCHVGSIHQNAIMVMQ